MGADDTKTWMVGQIVAFFGTIGLDAKELEIPADDLSGLPRLDIRAANGPCDREVGSVCGAAHSAAVRGHAVPAPEQAATAEPGAALPAAASASALRSGDAVPAAAQR